MRERCVTLDPSEALLARRRHDLAVAQQGCGAIVVEGGEPEDVCRTAAGAKPSFRVSSAAS
jgi:hypothetical protein